MPPRSAGVLLFRRGAGGAIEVLLGHPGGPFWAGKDDGAWGIPKGEVDGDEPLFAVALREFREETGHDAPGDEANAIPLGEIRKRSGKIVTGWAMAGDLDPATAVSNTFPLEWPPRSGRYIDVPEFDRLAWFGTDEARRRMRPEEFPYVERLLECLGQ
jgi:predicted NUDIX family NTP pyrophosphohydrolase